jgi:hypothetical protein
MMTEFQNADSHLAKLAIWTPAGWAFDWQGEVTYTRKVENAALWSNARLAGSIAKRLNGVVYDVENARLLLLSECR